MSWPLVTAAFEAKDLSVGEKFLLVALANRASIKTGECWPSHALMTADTGISPRSIINHLSALEAKGHISRRRRYRKGTNYRQPDMIHVHIVGAAIAGTVAAKTAPDMVQPLHMDGAVVAPKPKENQKEEPSGRPALALVEGAAPSPEDKARRQEVARLARQTSAELKLSLNLTKGTAR